MTDSNRPRKKREDFSKPSVERNMLWLRPALKVRTTYGTTIKTYDWNEDKLGNVIQVFIRIEAGGECIEIPPCWIKKTEKFFIPTWWYPFKTVKVTVDREGIHIEGDS